MKIDKNVANVLGNSKIEGNNLYLPGEQKDIVERIEEIILEYIGELLPNDFYEKKISALALSLSTNLNLPKLLECKEMIEEAKSILPEKKETHSVSFGKFQVARNLAFNQSLSLAVPVVAKLLMRIEELKKNLHIAEQNELNSKIQYDKFQTQLSQAKEELKTAQQDAYGEALRNKGLQTQLSEANGKIKGLENSKLTKEEFRTIACEYTPSIAKDSGQPEWNQGELDKLYEALTKGHWLYINRDKQIEILKQQIEELEKSNKSAIEISVKGHKGNKYSSVIEMQIDRLYKEKKELEEEIEDWRYQMAYYTREDIATPKGVSEFVKEIVEKKANGTDNDGNPVHYDIK